MTIHYLISLLPAMIEGIMNTLIIFTITILLSIPLGIVVSIGRLSKITIVSQIFRIYIFVMRGTPLLLQLVFIYFGLPEIGIVFNRFTAVIIAFVLNYAAYFGEIFRGGINSIDKGQHEAANVLGISKFNTFWKIVLPQTVKRTIPSVANEIVTLVKDTALVYVVGIGELLRAAKIASNRDASLVPFLLAGIIYLVVISFLSIILEKIEKKYAYYE